MVIHEDLSKSPKSNWPSRMTNMLNHKIDIVQADQPHTIQTHKWLVHKNTRVRKKQNALSIY